MGDVTVVPRASENDASGGTTFPVCRSVTKSFCEPGGPTGSSILTDYFSKC